MPRKILVVEDDADISYLLKVNLQDQGCVVDVVEDGQRGLETARRHRYDLIILDLMLPGLDGLEVCRQLRDGGHYVPILMLTARSTELDRVIGLELGADDYLVKPFSIRELIARVKAIFRRLDALSREQQESVSDVVELSGLFIDPDKRSVTVKGSPVELTAKEFDLLHYFARNPGRVFTRSQLLDQVWGYGHDGYEHTVNSHINRLRAKIEADATAPKYVLTVWGVGYKFVDAAPEAKD